MRLKIRSQASTAIPGIDYLVTDGGISTRVGHASDGDLWPQWVGISRRQCRPPERPLRV
jgi:hypothetical protein